MGRLGFDAIMARDFPVVMGVGTIAAFLTLAGNVLADVAYAAVDPRPAILAPELVAQLQGGAA